MPPSTVRLRVTRQDERNASTREEVFEIAYQPNMNVIGCLMEIQKAPKLIDGRKTTPVAWECMCLEEVCGACTMVINGQVRQACSALIDPLLEEDSEIRLEPMSKFPLVRDLVVDRSIMFENLKRIKAWIPIDGTHDLGPGPKMSMEEQQTAYDFSRCMTCGCCLEVCPQVNERSNFMGAAALAQAVLFNSHPTGAMNRGERMEAIMGPGGVSDCGNAQACVEACPKEIKLTEGIAALGRMATMEFFGKWLRR